MSTSSKKETKKNNENIGHDDNNTAKVNTKTYANIKETLNPFSEKNKEKRKRKRVSDAFNQAGIPSGKRDELGNSETVQSHKEYETYTQTQKAMRKKSIVDKKPKRRGTPK